MVNRKGVSVAVIVALALSVSALAQKKDDKNDKNDKKQTDEQKREIAAVVKLADDAAAGQPAANDLGVAWAHEDFMKAQGNKQYAPFTVTIDPAKVTAGTVTFYWRAVSKSAAPSTPVADSKDAKKDDKKAVPKRPEYAYEDVSFVPVMPGQAEGTEDEIAATAEYVRRNTEIQSVLFLAPRTHTARVRWLLRRRLPATVRVAVRSAPYDPFSADDWWRSRDASREVMAEYLRWVNTAMSSHFSPPRSMSASIIAPVSSA